MAEEFPKYIKLRTHRFDLEDISAVKCMKSSTYAGNPPVIVIWRKNITETINVLYKLNGKPDLDGYEKDRDFLDTVLFGKTAKEENILP